MFQFYIPNLSFEQQQVFITSEEFHHLRNVRRVKIGEVVQVFDGKGIVFKVKIKKFYKDKVEAEVLEKNFVQEKPYKIILCQAIIKIDKFELVIEKATEFAINKIVPIKFERSVVDLDRFVKKYDRFNKLIIEAAKQANCVLLPELEQVQKLENVFKENDGVNIVCYKNSEETLYSLGKKIREAKNIKIFVGPEGDFSEKEIEFLKQQKNVFFVKLAETILRSETAAIVALGIINQFKLSNY